MSSPTRWLMTAALLAAVAALSPACGDSGASTGGDETSGAETSGDETSDGMTGGPGATPDDEDASGGATDSDATGAVDPDAGPGDGTCPPDHVQITFSVDDSANQTYGPGQLIWTGSFAHDATTNTIAFASSWLPEEGPYPFVWDDGPLSAGGHEPEGASAGDHVFSVAVCYYAEQDRILSYGALNSDLRWIWVGANGQVEVPAGATGRVDLDGLVIDPFGDRDFKLFVEMAALHESFSTVSLATHGVYVKGTMNAWTPVQLLDDGQLGDEAAGDGVVTYQHGELLGPHDGLLRPGQEAQFVFVFAKGEADPDEGLEYKVLGNAAPEGVTAAGACVEGWEALEVIQSLDSKGIELNTAIVMCDDGPIVPPPECDGLTPCAEGEVCVDGSCEVEDTGPECDADTPCPDPDAVCINGACEVVEAECDDDTPCAGEGEVCDAGNCVVPGGQPELLLIQPSSGSTFGGTQVTLTGQGFVDGTTVTFGGAAATGDSVTPSKVVVLTPAHAAGPVDVVVTVPGGQQASYPAGYTYVVTESAPAIDGIDPSQGPAGGGTPVTISGSNFVAPVTVRFGTFTAPGAEVGAGGTTIVAVTPAAPVGSVTVTVVNGDEQEVSEPDGFAFVPELPDWGVLVGPATLHTVEGKATALLTAQVFEPGVTDAPGEGFGLVAEVGYGPAGSDPITSDAWVWSAAAYQGDVGNNDVFGSAITAPIGAWSATLRFSVSGGLSWLYVDLGGADDGFDPGDVAAVLVEDAGAVVLFSSEPSLVWPGGGLTVSVSGTGLAEGCTATLDGDALDDLVIDGAGGALSFTAPRHPPGAMDLVVTCPDGTDTLPITFGVTWDGDLAEWPAGTQLATTSLASDWGVDNVLESLHADTDGQNLYIGIVGHALGGDFGNNAIVAYVDTDYGEGTGVQSAVSVVDVDGAVDDALGGLVTFADAGFGAEVAFATLDGATYTPAVADPASVGAGWRILSDPTDLGWLLGASVVASESGVEAVLPLSELVDPDAPPSLDFGPDTYGVVVRITNASGTFAANQALPEGVSGADNASTTAAASFTE